MTPPDAVNKNGLRAVAFQSGPSTNPSMPLSCTLLLSQCRSIPYLATLLAPISLPSSPSDSFRVSICFFLVVHSIPPSIISCPYSIHRSMLIHLHHFHSQPLLISFHTTSLLYQRGLSHTPPSTSLKMPYTLSFMPSSATCVRTNIWSTQPRPVRHDNQQANTSVVLALTFLFIQWKNYHYR